MNILHMKYAAEVAKHGSINKAAEELLIAQPNISRSIKEIESDLGISIFERTAKGMILTPEGEEFIGYARRILKEIDDVENLYKRGLTSKKKFSIAVPRATYIAEAFSSFSKDAGNESIEYFYKETNSSKVINKVLQSEFKLGIIRYSQSYEKYFKDLFKEKDLCSDVITDFQYQVIVSKDSPIANKEDVSFDELEKMVEVAHPDPYVPYLPSDMVKKTELPSVIDKRIYVYERASQFSIISKNPNAYMWVSPVPQNILDSHNLAQIKCSENFRIYRDVLIRKGDYKLTNLDKKFIVILKKYAENLK